MAINSISSMLNSKYRISGLASGLDTDSIIQQLMSVERMKVDKVRQQRQVKEWQRDSYREVISTLRDFTNEYFDVLKPATNMRSASAFSAFSTKYDGADTSPYLSMTPGSAAKAGTYTISNVQTALAATATSSAALAGSLTGSVISDFSINSTNDNNKITVTLNGTSKEITVADNPANIDALVTDLQTKINTAFGSGKVTVGRVAGSDQLTFNTSGTNTLSVGNAYNKGSTTILGTSIAANTTLDNQNNKFKVTLGAVTNDITLATGTYANADALIAEVQSKLDTAFGTGKIRALNQNDAIVLKAIGTDAASAAGNLAGVDISGGMTIDGTNSTLDITIGAETKTITLDQKSYTKNELLTAIQAKMDAAFGSNKGMVSMDGSNHLRFESVDSTTTFFTAAKENGGLAALGLENANKSNKVDMSANLFDIKDNFSTPLNVAGGADDIQFTVNGTTFKFNSTNTSLSKIISTVNNDTTANVIMEYDELYDKITVRSKEVGVTSKVDIADVSGNLMTGALSLSAASTGRDASITYNDGSGSGDQVITRSTNSFSVNGIAFELKQDTAGPVSVSVASDTEKVFDLVKGFVEKYNEVIGKINTKLYEERDRDYLPLTDEQKEAMKDSDIEKWEEKAKSGLLRNDGILSGAVRNMRQALYDNIYTDSTDVNTKLSQSLYSIGISTSSFYEDRGKLVIDEAKLKEAIANEPDKIVQLFTKDDSGISYSEALNDPAKRSERYSESGLAVRLYDIIQDNIRITRNANGQKGALLEKAGMIGDSSEFTSLLYDQIEEYDTRINELNEKLYDKENRYYAKFAALEKVLSQMNNQGAWLSAQLGQGG